MISIRIQLTQFAKSADLFSPTLAGNSDDAKYPVGRMGPQTSRLKTPKVVQHRGATDRIFGNTPSGEQPKASIAAYPSCGVVS